MVEKQKGIYLPPVTEKGLNDKIEKFLKDKGQEKTLTIIKNDKRLKTVWELAIQLAYVHIGGQSLKGSTKENVISL